MTNARITLAALSAVLAAVGSPQVKVAQDRVTPADIDAWDSDETDRWTTQLRERLDRDGRAAIGRALGSDAAGEAQDLLNQARRTDLSPNDARALDDRAAELVATADRVLDDAGYWLRLAVPISISTKHDVVPLLHQLAEAGMGEEAIALVRATGIHGAGVLSASNWLTSYAATLSELSEEELREICDTLAAAMLSEAEVRNKRGAERALERGYKHDSDAILAGARRKTWIFRALAGRELEFADVLVGQDPVKWDELRLAAIATPRSRPDQAAGFLGRAVALNQRGLDEKTHLDMIKSSYRYNDPENGRPWASEQERQAFLAKKASQLAEQARPVVFVRIAYLTALVRGYAGADEAERYFELAEAALPRAHAHGTSNEEQEMAMYTSRYYGVRIHQELQHGNLDRAIELLDRMGVDSNRPGRAGGTQRVTRPWRDRVELMIFESLLRDDGPEAAEVFLHRGPTLWPEWSTSVFVDAIDAAGRLGHLEQCELMVKEGIQMAAASTPREFPNDALRQRYEDIHNDNRRKLALAALRAGVVVSQNDLAAVAGQVSEQHAAEAVGSARWGRWHEFDEIVAGLEPSATLSVLLALAEDRLVARRWSY